MTPKRIFKERKEIWLHIFVFVFLLCAGIWAVFVKFEELNRYRKLSSQGITTEAKIVKKGIKINGQLESSSETKPSDDHQLVISYEPQNGKEIICQAGISKSLYEKKDVGDSINISYLKEDPQHCEVSAFVSGSWFLAKVLLGFGGFFLVAAMAYGAFVYRRYTMPILTSHLSSKMNARGGSIVCPECGLEMAEGYMTSPAAIPWRKINEPRGLPTIFSGLPGTAFLFKPPKYHAYHCDKCRIITFKYGRTHNN